MHDRCPRVLLRVRTEIRHSLHSMPARCPDGRARLSLSSSLRSERSPKTTKNCSRQETVPTADVQGWRRTVLPPAQLKQAEPHWRSMNGPGGNRNALSKIFDGGRTRTLRKRHGLPGGAGGGTPCVRAGQLWHPWLPLPAVWPHETTSVQVSEHLVSASLHQARHSCATRPMPSRLSVGIGLVCSEHH